MLSADKIKKLTSSLEKVADNAKQGFCKNLRCNAKSEELQEANSMARAYFGVPTNADSWKICVKCRDRAETFEKESKEKIKLGGNLFSLKCEAFGGGGDDVIDLDSGDVEPHGAGIKLKSKTSVQDELNREITDLYSVSEDLLKKNLDEMTKSFGVLLHVNKCKKTLASEVTSLENDFADLDENLSKLNEQIHSLTKEYNVMANIKHPVVKVKLGVVDINGTGRVQVTEDEGLEQHLQEIGFTNTPIPVANFRKRLNPPEIEDNDDDIQVLPNPRVLRTQKRRNCENTPPAGASNVPTTTSLARAKRKLVFQIPKLNQVVYAMNGDLLNSWVLATIVEIHNIGANSNIFTVQIENASSKVSQGGTSISTRKLFGRQIAFRKPLTAIDLPVGTRVIGKFNDDLGNHPGLKGKFYAGIVAEPPLNNNNKRYLIFFDDGYAQYTLSKDVIPVVQCSDAIWEDVHCEVQEFTKDYLKYYPHLLTVRAKTGQQFSVEYDGQLLKTRVVENDCSLMKVQYPSGSKLNYEWIYVGSPRIKDVMSRYEQLKATTALLKEHSSNSSTDQMNSTTEKLTALKITSVTRSVDPIDKRHEFVGKNEKIEIPSDCPSPKPFTPHACQLKCAFTYIEKTFRKVSPLVIPFHLGWARQLKGEKCGSVSYITPCGLQLSNYTDINKYNRITHNNMSIEFFSLEPAIDCLNKFVSEPSCRVVEIKDISYGREWTPVQCVNSLNMELPDSLDYIQACVPGEGVKISNDDNFLTCCDCTDDCSDKEKCACWKLTLSGISFAKKPALQGYEFRRLKDWVESGIYECNSKCKCRVNSCLNRVVQNKVKWPVEIFRTAHKGWGVRAIHDIPKGSFLCLYTGKLLNDAAATQEGLKNGDEYLADLDFIEVMESIKEGYESDCSDIEDEKNVASQAQKAKKLQVARKSTAGRASRGEAHKDSVHGVKFNKSSKGKAVRYREYFGATERPYSVDGKKRGNFGRYFNHSCNPNLFIQTVFVGTHDLRFPSVAFFTKTDVKAGTELCWDYKYEVGSVPGKTLICHCGARNCRGRLL